MRFGELTKRRNLTKRVSHMESSVENHLNFSTTNGSLFTGSHKAQATSGFLHLTSKQVLRVYFEDNCLWSSFTDHIGKCGSPGYRDGNFTEARFNHPSKILWDSDRTVDRLFLSDSGNNVIRVVDLRTMNVSTLYKSDENLIQPVGMTWDDSTSSLIISGGYYIKKLEFPGLNLTTISGSDEGYLDGTLKEAKYGLLDGEIITLTSNIYLLADTSNNKVRMIDVVNNRVTTICSGEDNSSNRLIRSCQVHSEKY